MSWKRGKKESKKKDEKSEDPKTEMSFLDHLEALRWHIVRSLVAIMVVAIAVFLAKDFVFGTIIFGPIQADFITYKLFCETAKALCFYPENLEVINRDLQEPFINHLKVSFWLGLVAAFPYVFYEVWSFIKPGLYEKEIKAARGMVGICSFLFLTGVAFGYFVICPFAVSFLSNYDLGTDISNTVTLNSYVNSLTMFTLPVGLVFELPIVVYFLSKIGLITPEFMKQYRKHAVVVILIMSAVLTPPDVVTQILIGFPLYFLYEISIVISKRVVDGQKKREKEEEQASQKTAP